MDGIAIRLRNPIFGRELLTLLRSNKAFLFLGIYLAISIALMLLSWPRKEETLLVQGVIARELFSTFGLGQTLLLALLIPAIVAPCMTTEKEGETIDLLLTTPVTADQIVLGKLSSGVAYFVLLQLASLPVLLLLFVIGGLTSADVLGLYVFLFLNLLLFALTSVASSVFFHRTHIAVIVAYVFVALEALLLQWIYGKGTDTGIRQWTALAFTAVPMVGILYGIARAGARRPYVPVRKTMEEEDPAPLALVIRRDRFPDRLVVPPRRLTPLEDGVNPVLDKELQSEILGSGSQFMRWVIQLGLVGSLVAFFWVLFTGLTGTTRSLQHPEYPYFVFILAYVLILGPSISSTSFTNEKEQQTIESLVLTLLPRNAIVLGKFLAVLRIVGGLATLNCFLFPVIVLLSSHHYEQMIALPLAAIPATLFVTALGLLFSLHCRRTLTAMISTYFVLFALWVGPVLAENFLTKLIPGIEPPDLGFLTYVSPLLASRLTSGGPSEQLQTLAIHGSLVLAMTGAMLFWMYARFEAVVRKQAQQI